MTNQVYRSIVLALPDVFFVYDGYVITSIHEAIT